jgi:hypothetical protein
MPTLVAKDAQGTRDEEHPEADLERSPRHDGCHHGAAIAS